MDSYPYWSEEALGNDLLFMIEIVMINNNISLLGHNSSNTDPKLDNSITVHQHLFRFFLPVLKMDMLLKLYALVAGYN